jgi:hypothetical protein
MRPEHELNVVLSRYPLSDAGALRAQSLIASIQDWDAFFAFARRGWVEPVVSGNLVRIEGAVPPSVRDYASNLATEARATSLARTLLMNQLLSGLTDSGISSIVLKGPALGITAYGDPTFRSFGDIDLLIRRQEIIEARDHLLASGFSRAYSARSERALLDGGHALEFASPNLKVELHSALISKYLRVPFNEARIWSTSRSIECAGRNIQVLSPDVQFTFVCAHGAKHEWMQMRLICDVAQLLERMTEEEAANVASAAASLNAKLLVAIAVRLAESVFGDVKVPKPIADLSSIYDVSPIVDTISIRLELSDVPGSPELPMLARIHPALPPLVFWMSARERLRDRIAAAASLLLHAGSNGDGTVLGMHPFRVAGRAIHRMRSVR